MRYYKLIENSRLIAIGTGYGGEEITEAEYNTLLAEIRTKAELVDKLYSGEITLDDIPLAWREEIQRRVDDRIAAEGEAQEQEISGEELLSMLEAIT